MAKNLRTYLTQLLDRFPNDIVYVEHEVDPKYEITAIAERFEQDGRYPAVFFRRVKGSRLPVVTNLCGTYERLALALDTTREQMVDVYHQRVRHPVDPVVVDASQAPVQEVVWTGSEADLRRLPIPWHNEFDASYYLCSGVMICKDPDSGVYNAGLYRHMVQGPQQLGFWSLGNHHAGYIKKRYDELNRPMEVAIAVGHHPAFVMGAVSRVPGIGHEFEEAGALLQEPVELVRARTVDILVPAQAEIVIEGYMPPNQLAYEGPFGEWPGHYMEDSDKPFIVVTAITMRHNAIYMDVMPSHREHTVLGSLPRMGRILTNVKQFVPGVKAVNVPAHSRMHCYISITKRSDAEVKKAAFAALLTEPENLQLVIVVDDDINVFDDTEVLWAVGTRFQADRDLLVIPGWSGPGGLNPSGYEFHEHGKTPRKITAMIMDATKPAPPIPYSPRARAPQDLVRAVDPTRYRTFTRDDLEAILSSLSAPSAAATLPS